MARECRKCKNIIPVRIIVDGKQRNLQSRKFCLDCSPFGCHNTKRDIDRPSKKKGGYANWSYDAKMLHKARVYRKGLLRKDKLIEMAGGCCCKCGYNKCKRALQFHHVDPSTKNFILCINNVWTKSWQIILKEFNKCILVCANCHAEIEDEGSEHGTFRTLIAKYWPNKTIE